MLLADENELLFSQVQQRKTILRTQGCFVVKTFNLRTYQREKRMFSKSIFFLVSEVFQNS